MLGCERPHIDYHMEISLSAKMILELDLSQVGHRPKFCIYVDMES